MQVADLGGDALRALGDIDALRRRVVNVVGHALRTPVVNLAGMASALVDTDPGDAATRAKLGEAVRRNAQLVERLLDDLLIAAGVNTVLPVGTPQPTAALDAVRDWWAACGADRPLVVEADSDASVVIDPRSLERILDALLGNAVRYGSAPVSIAVGPNGDRVAVTIRSRGDHPPTPTEVSLAFELFYRGEHAVMAAPGLGVGLPVARALAQQAGGDVTLALETDGTVAATLELPAS